MTRKLKHNLGGKPWLTTLGLIGLCIVWSPQARATTPVPYIQSISPVSASIGAQHFVLTVTGAGFMAGSVVQWNGTALATTFVSAEELTAVVPTANLAAYATASVTVVNSGVPASNPAYFTATNSTDFLSFRLTQQSPSGGLHPYFPVAADFNGDGNLDLAVTNDSNTGAVSVFFGNGDGSFQGATNYTVGSKPEGLAIGDFNGDGQPDLAVANFEESTITILLNSAGVFAAVTTTLTTGLQPFLVAAADFNGDGKLDLAVVCEHSGAGFVTILLGNGDGTFGTPVNYGAIGQPAGLAVEDFDGNGTLDLAVSDTVNDEVWIFSGSGNGTFSAGTAYATAAGPAGLVAGDFNGDGQPDLAIAYDSSDQVSVLLNSGGTFPTHVEYPTAFGGLFLAAADMNGDGILDLEVPGISSNNVSVLLGNGSNGVGDGTFGPYTSFAINPTAPFTSVTGIAAADFNDDGRLDLGFTVGPGNDIAAMVQAPILVPSPLSLTFGDQSVGTKSAPQAVSLSNTGAAPLKLYAISSTETTDFPETNTCGKLPATLPPGGGCTVSATFSPSAQGSLSGSISITDNLSPLAIALTGTGTQLAVTLKPSSLAFGNQLTGATSTAQAVTLTNTGNSALGVTSISSSGDFAETNTCGGSVGAGASCTINVTFTPATTGALGGSISIVDAAPGSPQTVPLTGTGVQSAVSLKPASLVFTNQVVGMTSAAQPVTLTNSGLATLTITSIAASGDFAQTNTCGSSVNAGANCTISVIFTRTVVGTRTGAITITDNAPASPQTVGLTGTGIQPAAALSPVTLTFGSQILNTSSTAQAVTLTNPGGSALTVTSISASGDFSETNTCGASVNAGANCSITVIFKPTAGGARTGTLAVTDNASPATQTVALSGTGSVLAAAFSPTSLTFADQVVSSTSVAQAVTLTNTGTVGITITSFTVAGDFVESNNCGTSLAAGATCTVSVEFKPTTTGTRAGTLTASGTNSSASGSGSTMATVSLSGSGTGTPPTVTLSPSSLLFSTQIVSTSSTSQSVTLTNTGAVSLAVSSITASGDFLQTNACGSSLPANGSCGISVTFKPTQGGARTGILTVTDNAVPTTQTVSLTGTGSVVAATVSPVSLTFAGELLGTTSAAEAVTLTNTGTLALALTVATTGDFSQTNNCGATLAAGADCTLNVTLTPSATGNRTGTMTVTYSSGGVSANAAVTLTGTGTEPVATLSPAVLPAFAGEAIGAKSPAQIITLTNTGSAPLSVTAVALTGTNKSDFTETNNCGASIPAGASCALNVTFTPAALGAASGTLTITDNNDAIANSAQSFVLTGLGSGALAAVTPSALVFASENVGSSSPASSITLTNSGNAPLTMSSMAIASGSTHDFAIQSNSTCGTTVSVAAGKSCAINVIFTPSAPGSQTANLTISDGVAGGAIQTVGLSGTGKDFSILVGPTSASASPGTSAHYTATLTPQGGFSGTVQLTCAEPVALTESTCTATPASVTLNGAAAAVMISVTTTAAALAPVARRNPPAGPFREPLTVPAGWLLAAVGIIGMLSFGKKRRPRMLLATTALVVLWASCGGGSNSSGSGNTTPATPAGAYTITLNASGGNLTHTGTVTLNVP